MADDGERLSCKDKDVLDSIFSPTSTFGLEYFTEANQDTVLNGDHEPESENEKKAREIEVEAVGKAEHGYLDVAVTLLDDAIKLDPHSASVYNNRAQVHLLKGSRDAAKMDLERCLELCNSQGNVAGQAFTQLGLIHRLDGNNELAMKDFQQAAELGNAFAKSQVTALNPYAALCNQMLSQAIGQLRCGESDF